MDDDFNTTIAISELYTIFKYINLKMKESNKANRNQTANTLANILDTLKELYEILGLFTQNEVSFINELKNKYIRELDISIDYINEKIAERYNAKANKEYELADSIRNELLIKGIILNDTKDGTIWDVKKII